MNTRLVRLSNKCSGSRLATFRATRRGEFITNDEYIGQAVFHLSVESCADDTYRDQPYSIYYSKPKKKRPLACLLDSSADVQGLGTQ